MKTDINWRKIKRPKSWRPKEPGEELVGYYCGRTLKNGQWGQYEVLTIIVPKIGAFMVSGIQIIQLADMAMLKYGAPIKIKFVGLKPVGQDHMMKEFELYVSDEDLTVEDVIQVKQAIDENEEYQRR